jgi:hypothetical protein
VSPLRGKNQATNKANARDKKCMRRLAIEELLGLLSNVQYYNLIFK